MGARDFLSRQDTTLLQQLRLMAEGIGNDPGGYGLTPAQALELSDSVEDFADSMTSFWAAKVAFQGALTAKNTSRDAAKALARVLARMIQADQAVTGAQKASIGLTVPDTARHRVRAETPQALIASADGNGNIRLKWLDGGNKPGTIYIIESRGEDEPWTIIDSTTKRSYLDPERPVGVFRQYRILAKRASGTSPASTPISIWSGGSGEIDLREAA